VKQRQILLVEDNPSDVDLTRRALARGELRAELVVANDGAEALDYLLGKDGASGADSRELPALILLDLKLPKVPGLEVLRRIRNDSRTRRAPVVILTTSKEHSDVAAGYDLGANSYIAKPVNFAEFAAAMERIGSYWLVLNEPLPE
jgi:CheY-like chemotaxis protein